MNPNSGKLVVWSWSDTPMGRQCRLASVTLFGTREEAERYVGGQPELAVYPLEYDPPLAIEQSRVVIKQLRKAAEKGLVRDGKGHEERDTGTDDGRGG